MGKGNVVTFEVSVPEGVATRSYTADGSNVNDLVYAVYSTEATTLEDAQNGSLKFFYAVNETTGTSFSDGKSVVSLELLNNQNYLILFWAQSNDAWVSAQGSDINLLHVTYPSSMSANNMHLEAFSGVAFIQNVKGARKETVKLTRPFAQINLATTMPEAFTATLSQSSMTVTGAPAYFDVRKQSASGETTEEPLSFTAANVPDADFGKAGYEYAGANYIFAGAENTVNVEYKIYTSHGVVNNEVPSVPVQKNYRTNIIGNLLTSTAGYTVELDNRWGTPDYQVELWDGKTIKAVTPNENDNNIYEIDEPSELAWLAAAVNGTLPESKSTIAAQDFAGKTFRLTKDINLDNREWTPIGNGTAIFKGTFDGQNHTVKNLLINGSNKQDQGLFGVTHDGEIKNLVVENAMVSGRLNVGVVAGQPYTSKYTDIIVMGHVEVNGMAYVGGVGGKNAYADWANIEVNVDETSYVRAHSIENGNAYRSYVGGVVGFNGEGGHSFKNITSNIDVKGSTIDVGGLFGIAHYGNQFENCSCSGDVEIYAAEEADEAQEIGGIAGVWHNETGYSVTMTGCEFTGTLTTNIEGVAFYYNGLVGKPYSATGNGKLIIDGSVYVASAAELQAAVTAATGEMLIKLGTDIEGNVTVIQKQGVKITIDGLGHKYNGFIKVHSNSNHYADAALTIKNVNFERSELLYNAKGEPYFNFIEALENGAERYSTNITAENCTFTATGEAKNIAVALQIKSSKWAKALNCTATDLHSLVQAQSCDETVVVNGCTITGKNGVAFKQVKNAVVEGTTITATAYGIRFDGNTDNYGITVKDNNVTAAQPFIVRKMTGKDNTIALDGTNTLTVSAASISTETPAYQIIITNGSDDEAYVKPTGTYTLTGADNYLVYPRDVYFFVATWDEFTAALAANEPKIKLTDNIEYSANYQLQKDVVIDLNGKSMTLPMINIHTKTTIKNGTINGKVYARKNSEIVFNNVKFSGAVADNLSTEGHLAIQGGCKSLYAKDCLFSPTSVSGSQTKPLSFEGGSTIMKFENCEFKSSPYKKQVYFNSLSATAKLDFTNCNFNNKTPNIMFAAACPLTNLTMSGTTKLSSVTLETNRAKDAVTAEDLAYLRESLIANNSMSSVRLFYAGGSSEYIR